LLMIEKKETFNSSLKDTACKKLGLDFHYTSLSIPH